MRPDPLAVVQRPAPTRVTIDDVRPGDAVAFHGDTLDVSADLRGLRDGRAGDACITPPPTARASIRRFHWPPSREGNRYQCALPPGNLGLQQDVSYYLVAGDCTTRPFHVEVQIAPAILVDKIEYHYPDYTGMADRSVSEARRHPRPGRDAGDHPRHGQSRHPAGRDRPGLQRAAPPEDGRRRRSRPPAPSRWRWTPKIPTRPQHDSYQLLFTDAKDRGNTRPIRYRIDVVRDLPPEVKFTSPDQEESQVAEDGRLEIGVWAQDPDFALRRVLLRAERDGRSLPIQPLLSRVAPEPAFTGQFKATYCLPARTPGAQGRRPRGLLGRGRRQQGADGESLGDRPSGDHRGRRRRAPHRVTGRNRTAPVQAGQSFGRRRKSAPGRVQAGHGSFQPVAIAGQTESAAGGATADR